MRKNISEAEFVIVPVVDRFHVLKSGEGVPFAVCATRDEARRVCERSVGSEYEKSLAERNTANEVYRQIGETSFGERLLQSSLSPDFVFAELPRGTQ